MTVNALNAYSVLSEALAGLRSAGISYPTEWNTANPTELLSSIPALGTHTSSSPPVQITSIVVSPSQAPTGTHDGTILSSVTIPTVVPTSITNPGGPEIPASTNHPITPIPTAPILTSSATVLPGTGTDTLATTNTQATVTTAPTDKTASGSVTGTATADTISTAPTNASNSGSGSSSNGGITTRNSDSGAGTPTTVLSTSTGKNGEAVETVVVNGDGNPSAPDETGGAATFADSRGSVWKIVQAMLVGLFVLRQISS